MPANRISAAVPWRYRLCVLVACCWGSCGDLQQPTLLIKVSNIPPGASLLEALVTLDKVAAREQPQVPLPVGRDTCSFVVFLPRSAAGTIIAGIGARDAQNCLLGMGAGSI